MQARRLLDQVTILASGEAIVFGSAFHVPARVQFDRPEPGPYSQTAAPYFEWRTETTSFPLAEVIVAWGLESQGPAEDTAPESASGIALEPSDEDFEF
jgi:DNA helicase HerA-like ATPase